MNLKPRRSLAAFMAAVVAVTLVHAPAAAARGTVPAPALKPVPSVPVKAVKAAAQPADTASARSTRPVPVWPTGGQADVELSGARRFGQFVEGHDAPDTAGVSKLASVGGLPVRLTAGNGARAQAVRVQTFDRKATESAGVRGVLVRATPLTPVGRTDVEIGYAGFAGAFGADWAARLRLVALPECALTTPSRSDCAGTPLVSTNDVAAQTVSAPVTLSQPMLLSIQAAPSGATGDYTATTLQPSSTWSAGGNSGAFTWSYPMRVPPAVGGPKPSLSLAYSSQSVDGRHAATNNQPSWMGEGFDFWPGGYIERRYGGCAKDMANGANNTVKTGDQCWVTDNATLSLEGSSGELLYNATEQRWHLRADDGSRIERKTGADNGDNDGEYWVLTNSAGTQFWFGSHKLPGWAAGDAVTNSAWTAPVFGNHSGEPCHATAFADSDCTQVWRWNLDYVVDVHGNSMSFWYGTEGNNYRRNADPADTASYVRGGYLTHISYGTRTDNGVDSVLDASAPAKVVFGVADRCLADCANTDGDHWPDTPWDQNCQAGPCTSSAPTFFTTRRLASVTTQVWRGAAYADVERWTFTHSFPNPNDGTRAGLWLDKISHSGLVGGTINEPDITFTPVSLDNRVDAIDAAPAMAWHRIASISTETGGTIGVAYSARDCETYKPQPESNTSRCYPSMWTREGDQNPTIDWFHKYVVTDVMHGDMVGQQAGILHHYDYLDGAAWHYTDDDGLIQPENKTWSVFRGYGRVGVTVGDGDDVRTYTETRYFRGMNGDKLPSGARDVDVVDSMGVARDDDDWLAGRILETVTYNGPQGAEVSGTIHEPWASAPTASRTINQVTVDARMINEGTTIGWTALDGGRPDRVTRKTTQYDAYGKAITVEDFGIDGVPGDEQCARMVYEPRNLTKWLTGMPHQVSTFAVGCAAAGNPAALAEADVVSVARILYDNQSYLTAPSKGLATTAQEASAWNSGSPTFVTVSTKTYDLHGRPLVSSDALNRATTTAYTPATGGPVTGTTVTNALNHVTSATFEPAFGLPTQTVDPNGKTTQRVYDALGRTKEVWLPGGTQPQFTFAYDVRKDKVSSVTTNTLNTFGQYVTGHVLYDGLMRPVQTQDLSPSGGRILTNTFYDTLGRAWQTYGAYYNADPPSTTYVTPLEYFNIPDLNRTLFDGAGRVTAHVFRPYDVERWRTSYTYGGDRADVTPPPGGVATSTIMDMRGRIVELRQYDGPTPTGTYGATTYEYNRKDQLAAVQDPDGNRWTYTYDLRGRQIRTTDPDKGATTIAYDNAGQITSTIDARNVRLAYTYDLLGRKKGVFLNLPIGTPQAAWSYDTVAKGQLFQSVRFVSGEAYVYKVDGYTDLYQPTSTTVTIPNTETGLAGNYTQTFSYHVNGAPNAVAWSATADLPTEAVYHEYDELGLPKRLLSNLNGANSSYVTNTVYSALGFAEQYEYYTGYYSEVGEKVWLTYERELETSRVTRGIVSKSTSPGTITDTTYAYDPAGNVKSVKDAVADDNQCFGYDQLRRLTEAWTPASGDCDAARTVAGLGGPAPYWTSWTHDRIGNRQTQVEHTAAGDNTTAYTYPAPGGVRPHALSSTTLNGAAAGTWGYDNTGNTNSRPGANGQQTLTWNVEGHLASLKDGPTGLTTSYIYDADGNRLIAKNSASKTLWLPGQEIRYVASTGTATCTRYYTFAGGTVASRNATGLSWLAPDHQGTSQITVAETGQQTSVRRQKPYGESRGTAPVWPNGKGFVGGDIDPTGLTHLGAREYDPAIGRFISVDPIMDFADPQQWHAYAYANNSPVTLSDPSGLSPAREDRGDYKTGPGECDPASRICTYETDEGVPVTTYLNETDSSGNPIQCIYNYCPDSKEVVNIYTLAHQIDEQLRKFTNFDKDNPTDIQINALIYAGCLASGINICSPDYVRTVNEYGGFLQADQYARDHPGDGLAAAAAFFMLEVIGQWTPGCGGQTGSGRGIRRNSFDPDTEVLLADGTTKKIKDIEVGDEVLATDPEAGKTAAKPVTELHVNQDEQLTLLTVADGKSWQVIETTWEHLFWVDDNQQWIPASELRPGMQLRTSSSQHLRVVNTINYLGSKAMHDLTVADIHAYYVLAGNTPVLVHNNDGEWTIDPSKSTKIMRGGPFGAKYYQQAPNSKGEVLWWSPDLKGDGGSKWKVYKETSKGLEWIADADVNGNYMPNKHKGEKGKFISWGSLKGC